jgi:hypothetical protein
VLDSNLGALTALRRLRRVETDAARRALGEAVTQEAALAAREAELERESREARQIHGDFDREAFTAWLGRIRAERAQIAVAARDAATHVASARTILAQRRVAETSAEQALSTALAAKAAMTAHREQVMLEDVARALKRSAD